MIKHHVKEEEKPGEGFFAQARKGDVDMEALGGTLEARKGQLLAAIKAGRPARAGNPQLHGPQAEAGPCRGGRRLGGRRPRRGGRDRLVHLLTEAAEIEHNLLCSM